jgi:hypothetical protein
MLVEDMLTLKGYEQGSANPFALPLTVETEDQQSCKFIH